MPAIRQKLGSRKTRWSLGSQVLPGPVTVGLQLVRQSFSPCLVTVAFAKQNFTDLARTIQSELEKDIEKLRSVKVKVGRIRKLLLHTNHEVELTSKRGLTR